MKENFEDVLGAAALLFLIGYTLGSGRTERVLRKGGKALSDTLSEVGASVASSISEAARVAVSERVRGKTSA